MPETEFDGRIIELLSPANSILDIGCGDGRLLCELASERRRSVIGLDNSNHGFATAMERATQAAVHALVKCVEGDACKIAFRDSHFDGVLMTNSLHHIEEAQQALKEVNRVLVPRGFVLIVEWIVEDESQSRDGCYRFTLKEMVQMLREANFHQVDTEPIESDMALVMALK